LSELEEAPQEHVDWLSIDYDSLSHSNINSNTNINSNSTKEDIDHCKELFDVFWELYPRKQAKQRALSSWLKLRPNATLAGKITESVKAHIGTDQWQDAGGRYIPHAATFLNQKRWEDEVVRKGGVISKKYGSVVNSVKSTK
jgi:hypothetical protein